MIREWPDDHSASLSSQRASLTIREHVVTLKHVVKFKAFDVFLAARRGSRDLCTGEQQHAPSTSSSFPISITFIPNSNSFPFTRVTIPSGRWVRVRRHLIGGQGRWSDCIKSNHLMDSRGYVDTWLLNASANFPAKRSTSLLSLWRDTRAFLEEGFARFSKRQNPKPLLLWRCKKSARGLSRSAENLPFTSAVHHGRNLRSD